MLLWRGFEYMEIAQTAFTIIFQLLNTVLIIGIVSGIVYAVYYLVVKLPRDLRKKDAKLDNIEKILGEIIKKIDK